MVPAVRRKRLSSVGKKEETIDLRRCVCLSAHLCNSEAETVCRDFKRSGLFVMTRTKRELQLHPGRSNCKHPQHHSGTELPLTLSVPIAKARK